MAGEAAIFDSFLERGLESKHMQSQSCPVQSVPERQRSRKVFKYQRTGWLRRGKGVRAGRKLFLRYFLHMALAFFNKNKQFMTVYSTCGYWCSTILIFIALKRTKGCMMMLEGSAAEDFFFPYAKQKTCRVPHIPHNRCLVSSCCRAPDCRAGGRGFKTLTARTLRVLK